MVILISIVGRAMGTMFFPPVKHHSLVGCNVGLNGSHICIVHWWGGISTPDPPSLHREVAAGTAPPVRGTPSGPHDHRRAVPSAVSSVEREVLLYVASPCLHLSLPHTSRDSLPCHLLLSQVEALM